MRRAATASFIILVLFFGGVLQSLNLASGQSENVNYVIKMSVTYSNRSNDNKNWTFTEDDRTISLFMNNTWQTVELTNSTRSIETETIDSDGNPVAILEFPVLQISPGQNLTFNATYHVVSKPRLLPLVTDEGSGVLQDIPEDLRNEYTKEEGPWLTSNSILQNLANNWAGTEDKVLTIVKRLVSQILNNIVYEVHEIPYYANETWTERKGDCDDQAILFITLSRILGIPAYLQVGAIYLPTEEYTPTTYWEDHIENLAKRIGWHGWAMVYVPPWGWLPVDLTFAQGNPSKSITNAAVTGQNVIQYMNISKFDYAASSRQSRGFLIENDFYVYSEDEMIEEKGPVGPFGEVPMELLAVGLVIVVVILASSSLLVSRRLRRGTEEEILEPQQ